MSEITDKIAEMVAKLRRAYPKETAGMTDLDLISHVVPTSKHQAAPPSVPTVASPGVPTAAEKERRRLEDEKARRTAQARSLTKGGVALLWNNEVDTVMKRDGIGRSGAINRLLQTEEGLKLFKAMDDPSIPAGPAPKPYTPPVQSESVLRNMRAGPSAH